MGLIGNNPRYVCKALDRTSPVWGEPSALALAGKSCRPARREGLLLAFSSLEPLDRTPLLYALS